MLFDRTRFIRFLAVFAVAALTLALTACPSPVDSPVNDLASGGGEDPPTSGGSDPEPASSEKAIVSLTLEKLAHSQFLTDYHGVVDESAKTVSVVVPYGSDLTALRPRLSLSDGASSEPASRIPVDLSSPVIYTVTAADESTQPYTVSATVLDQEASTSNVLSGLSLDQGSLTFDAATLNYELPLGATVSSIAVTPRAVSPYATIIVTAPNDQTHEVASDTASPPLPLQIGENIVTVEVIPFDASTSLTYRIVIDRGAPQDLALGVWQRHEVTAQSGGEYLEGGNWFSFNAQVGQRYLIAIDDDDDQGWNPTNGGDPQLNASQAANMWFRVYRADGTTGYEYDQALPFARHNSQELEGVVRADSIVRYVPIVAADTTVRIRAGYFGFSGAGTFSIQVRQVPNDTQADVLELESWRRVDYRPDPWRSQEPMRFTLPTQPGETYRVGVDTAVVDSNEDIGWGPTYGGLDPAPVGGTFQFQVLRSDDSPYQYVGGTSGWKRAEENDTQDVNFNHKYISFVATGTQATVVVSGFTVSPAWHQGSFGVQARQTQPLAASGLVTGQWQPVMMRSEDGQWDVQRRYRFDVTPGRWYRVALDDRSTNADYGWTPDNGGYTAGPLEGQAYLRVFRSDGETEYEPTNFNNERLQKWGDWFVLDDAFFGSPGQTDRYVTIYALDNEVEVHLRDAIYHGNVALQLRPLPVEDLQVDTDWNLSSVAEPDSWRIPQRRLLRFPAVPGQTYYVSVDDSQSGFGRWTPTNGGYSPAPTARVRIATRTPDERLGGFGLVSGDGVHTVVAQEDYVLVQVVALEGISGPNPFVDAGTFAIRVTTTDPGL